MPNITPDTTVRFLKNVPFSNNYRNVMDFVSVDAQSSYFLSLPYLEITKLTYMRNNGALKVGKSRDEMLQYNYLMFQNKAFSNKWFYAFITDVSYLNSNACLVSFELDVWQSWLFDMRLMPSYIERKHCRRWNSDGSPVINTIPESLDFGSEYQVKNVRYSMEQDLNNQVYWLVFVTTLQYGTGYFMGGVPQQLTLLYYPISTNKRLIAPNQRSLWGVSSINGSSLGGSPVDILRMFRDEESYAKTLVSCYITDYVPFDYLVTKSSVNGGVDITTDYLTLVQLGKHFGSINEFQLGDLNISQIRYNDRRTVYSNKYMGLSGVTESKLLMYPYSFVELTDFQGNTFQIKNEYVSGNDISIDTLGSVESNQKVGYVINNYLNNNRIYNKVDYGIINAEPHNITIVDSYSAAYLQGNANTLRQSIASTHAQTALNNSIAQSQADVTATNGIIKGNADLVSATLNMGSNVLQGLGQGGLVGGLTGGLSGTLSGVGTANQVLASRMVTENTNEFNIASTKARGELNNQLAIKSTLAKVQDIKNVADTANLQGGNTGFTIGNNIHGYALVAKQITPEYIAILTDYFEKYGYAYHKVETPNIRTRQSWDYIQTTGSNIRGNIPQNYIDALEKIFDSGVTIWHNKDVGNYNLSNNEL